MATQIISTNGSYNVNDYVTAEIPVGIAAFNVSATQNAVISTSVYSINKSQVFPQNRPSWVLTDPFMALLVESGGVVIA
jgi:hypothetical protein